jgi:hypothetical protein
MAVFVKYSEARTLSIFYAERRFPTLGGLLNIFFNQRFLAIYSGLLTLIFAVTVLCGFSMVHNAQFGIITARRINIVEPDGTVRLTLSNQADFPGAWNRRKEYPRPDRQEQAGLLFMSEEGSEQGGLIWGAKQLPDGTIENHGHLSLDQYEENTVFAIDAGQEGQEKFSRVTIEDQGDYSIQEKRTANDRIMKMPADKQDAAWGDFFASHRHDIKRLVMGRATDGSVGLNLRDRDGKVRILLAVLPNGEPVLQFLDDSGKVVRELQGDKK